MEDNSLPRDLSLLETIREAFGRVVYTHKSHEVMIDIMGYKSCTLKWAEIIMTALSASGITTAVIVDSALLKICSGILSFLSLALVLYKSNLGIEERMISHRSTANRLWLLREKYINLISDHSGGYIDVEEARRIRTSLQNELKTIYDTSPQIESSAYVKAQSKLKEKEDFTFSRDEINKFLPDSLALAESTNETGQS